MKDPDSPSKRRPRRRFLFRQLASSGGPILLFLTIGVTFLLLRDEVEDLTEQNGSEVPDLIRGHGERSLEGRAEWEEGRSGGLQLGGEERGGDRGWGVTGTEGSTRRQLGEVDLRGGGISGSSMAVGKDEDGILESTAEEESGSGDSELDDRLIQEITIVICAKHTFSSLEANLRVLTERTPAVPILYVMSGPMTEASRASLMAMRRDLPQLELRDAGKFSSGYSMRNATAELIKTKYALFIFSDVVPQHKRWLHELFLFAESRVEGVVFQPFVWESRGEEGDAVGGATTTTKKKKMIAAGGREYVEEDLQVHSAFHSDMTFDDYSNDGKLYVQRIQDSQVSGTQDPKGLEPRESPAGLEDHCLLVRDSFLSEAIVFDPRAGFTRQDLDLALTLRYWNYKSFLVPNSTVIYQHPAASIVPADLPYFASQSNEEVCAGNQVYLRQKWGIIVGQLCRGFVDSALRNVVWKEDRMSRYSQGEQAQLIISSFSLIGLNRFQMRHFPTWHNPASAPPFRCKSRDSSLCRNMVPWMSFASDFTAMVDQLQTLDGAIASLQQRRGQGGRGQGSNPKPSAGNSSEEQPQLWMGRAELHLPLRLNRVEDPWKATSLRSGQLFAVRRGVLKSGEKHAGRRAPDLPMLMRMYLSLMLIEMELEVAPMGLQGLEKLTQNQCFSDGMSLIVQEECQLDGKDSEGGGKRGGGGRQQADTGFLLTPNGRRCVGSHSYYRAWMFVRHMEPERPPLRVFDKLKRMLLQGSPKGQDGWVDAKRMSQWMSPCLKPILRRLRLVICVPGSSEACALDFYIGSVPNAWKLVHWAWRPQSVRTAQILLMKKGHGVGEV